MPIPGNMLSASTEMVDPNTSGWAALLNCTLGLGSGGRNGDGTLRLTATAAGEMQARTAASYPIVPGTTYLAFADASSSTQPERIGIRWLSAGNAEISVTWSLTTSSASATWHRVSVAGAAPADAVRAQVVVSATAGAAGATHFWDNLYLGLPRRFTGNLFGFNTESAEVDASGWVPEANATITRTVPPVSWPVDFYLAGGHVMAATAVADGDMAIATAERPVATPGTEYMAYAYLAPPTSSTACWVEIRFFDEDGMQLAAERAYLGQTATGWMRQIVSGTAPADTATCGIAAGIDGAAAGQSLGVEGVVMAVAAEFQTGSVVPYSDASFEQGVGSWVVVSGSATIARSAWSASAGDGTHYLVVTSAAAGTTVLRSGLWPLDMDGGGLSWRWQVWAQVASGAWDIARSVRWYDDEGTEVGATLDTPGAAPTPGWWSLTNDAVAPAGATQAAIEYTLTATAASSTLWLDRVALWQALSLQTAEPLPGIGAIRLTLRELHVGQLISIWRVTPDGARTLVRGPDGLYDRVPIDSDELIVEDYEAPLGVPITYWVETYSASTGALTERRQTDPPVVLDPGDPNGVWLKDPANPQRNMRLVVQSGGGPDWTRPARSAEYVVRGRQNPIVVSDVRGGRAGDLQVWTRDDAERDALRLLLSSGTPLLWQTAPGFGVGQVYVTVGDVTEARVSPYGREPWRGWTLPLTETDMPTSGVNGSAGRTWRDVLTEFATWQDVLDSYATWEGVLLDHRIGA